MFHDFPYTNFNELNLDYTLKKVNEFNERLDSDEAILNTLPEYIKNVELSHNTLVFTKGNNDNISIVLPSLTIFNLIIKEDEDEKTINGSTLNVGDEITFDNDYDYNAYSELENSVLAGNVGRLTIKGISDNIKTSGYVYYNDHKLYFDLMVRYYDSTTEEMVYQWRSFIINWSYVTATHVLTIKLQRIK